MIYNFKKIGQRIKENRERLNMTQDDLIARYETITEYSISRPTLSKWENGQPPKDINDYLILCRVFNCELGYLLCEFDTPKRKDTDVIKETGLTLEGITALRQLSPEQKEILDDILTRPKFKGLLQSIHEYTHSQFLDPKERKVYAYDCSVILSSIMDSIYEINYPGEAGKEMNKIYDKITDLSEKMEKEMNSDNPDIDLIEKYLKYTDYLHSQFADIKKSREDIIKKYLS